MFITKPDHILQKMDSNSEEIKQENNIDKYSSRPNILKDMCLADFVALAQTTYQYNKEILSDDNMSISEDTPVTQTTNNDTNDLKKIFPIKLTHNKILKLCKQCKVIRFINYKYKIDPENYCREKLLLYIPWQHNDLNILQTHKTYIDAYNHFQNKIIEKL